MSDCAMLELEAKPNSGNARFTSTWGPDNRFSITFCLGQAVLYNLVKPKWCQKRNAVESKVISLMLSYPDSLASTAAQRASSLPRPRPRKASWRANCSIQKTRSPAKAFQMKNPTVKMLVTLTRTSKAMCRSSARRSSMSILLERALLDKGMACKTSSLNSFLLSALTSNFILSQRVSRIQGSSGHPGDSFDQTGFCRPLDCDNDTTCCTSMLPSSTTCQTARLRQVPAAP
mmetsp:Transcript_48587/g.104113  ORF Transcript_48587/g.104113 Transcript_48587/m.104113 type:complete len:231 (-) Transcript_48587:549-1241(-)